MEPKPIGLAQIANDTRVLSQRLKGSNVMDATLQQLVSQLIACNTVESEVEGWLDNVGPLLERMAQSHQDELAAERAKVARLEAANAALKAGEQSSPVDDITGYKRPPLKAVDNDRETG